MGKWKDRIDVILGFCVCSGLMILLGIFFGNRDDVEINWEIRLGKVLIKFNMWKLRRLFFSGKVLVIKFDILLILFYMVYVFFMSLLICFKL